MVGLIPKLLLDLIESTATLDAVKEVKRLAGVPPDKKYSISETYDDDEWQRLLAATCDVLQISPEQAEEAFAEFFFKDSLKRWPTWFQISKNARELLERQPIIHNGFATSMQNPNDRKAINEKFRLESFDKELVMHYCSPNRLCGLYKALARRILDHYGDQATLRETRCLKKGDSACEIHICWN
ncbi:MAG: heme NO-binding domain-containing protein [Planctomycetes bacterium]|nr:heme NO-binding domain-containing protein [Planctomycetota bacterium]